MKIDLFIPCFVDQMTPQVGVAVTRVLERLGHTCEFRPAQTCCGQPSFNAGYWDEARAVAIRALDVFAGAEAVVGPSGSCVAMMRVFYPELLKDTPHESRALDLAARTFEFGEFLVDKLGVTDVGARFPHRVTYHDGCHGLRELRIKNAPRMLLTAVQGLELIECDEPESC
jgi:L-lactate dehydrogenase complex protein LldE